LVIGLGSYNSIHESLKAVNDKIIGEGILGYLQKAFGCAIHYLIFLTKIIWNNRHSQCLKNEYQRVIIHNTDHKLNMFSCRKKIEHDLASAINIKSKLLVI
jgi:hypothetical protein